MDDEDVDFPVRADDTKNRDNNTETINVINECAINGNAFKSNTII